MAVGRSKFIYDTRVHLEFITGIAGYYIAILFRNDSPDIAN